MKKTQKFFIYLALIFFFTIFFFPTFMLLISAFKVDESALLSDLGTIRAFLPTGELGFQNFIDIFNRLEIFLFLKNSLIITTAGVIFNLFVNSLCGYSIAKMGLKHEKLLLTFFISIMIIPGEAIAIPNLLTISNIGLIDTLIAQIIPGIGDAFTIYLFYQAFKTVPDELTEAAIMDNANYFQIFFKLSLPIVKPTIITVAILTGLGKWGDVFWPTMVSRSAESRPLAIAMQQLFTAKPEMWGDIFAFATLMTLPVLILFIIFQKHFVNSMSSSGIK